jgi:hypothetical protein
VSEIGRPGNFIIHARSQKYQFRQVSEYLVLQTVWQGTSADTLSLLPLFRPPVLFDLYKDSRSAYRFHHRYNRFTRSLVIWSLVIPNRLIYFCHLGSTPSCKFQIHYISILALSDAFSVHPL